MKIKIKRHSRSAVSVLLSICMLISCVAVGLVGSEAAQVGSESVGATASGTVYADGRLKGNDDWISLPMYYDTASGNYYCPASIKNGGEWKFHDSSAKYGSQSDYNNDRDISQYGGVDSNYEVVKSGRESTFRLKKGSTVDCTVWLKGDLTRTWVTEGKTAPPSVTVSLAANPTNVTAKVTNSSTTITAESSGSLVIGSESTINVTVDSSVSSTKKAVSATVTTSDSSETVNFSSNGDGTYTATFTVPDKNATVTVNPLEDKSSYKVKVVANDPIYGSVLVTSAGGAAYDENLRYAEDTPIVLSATAAADHPFQSWDKGTDKTNAAATYYVNGNDADEDNDEVITITAIFKSNYYKASSTIVGDTGKVFQGITARFFDYYYDTEVKEGWLQYTENDAKDDNQQPYTILNQALKTYASAKSVPVPLYFGNMYSSYNGMYGNQTPANVTGVTSGQNSTDYHYYKAANNSNGIKELYGIGNNYNYGTALTGLSGKNLNSSGNITHVSDKDSLAADSEVEMKLFDKDWLTSRSGDGYAYTGPLATIIDSPFPFVKETIKRVYFDNTGEYTHVYTWSGSGDTEVKHNGSWPGTPLLTDTATGKKYINVSTDAEFFILNNGSDNKKTGTLNFNWASGNCYNVSGSSWSTVADDDKGNYYSFDSKGGQDNAYFTGIRDGEVSPVMNYYRFRNKVHDREGNNNYGFFPFDGNLAGTNDKALDYGYGMRMDIEFTLGENGKNPLGQDQIFKFSGDDDLWVYIDGKLVLDLGGAHGRSTGEINFAYTTGVGGATDTTNNTTVTVDAVKSMYSTAQNAGTNTTALPSVHYTSDSNKGVTRNETASVDRTLQKHTMTVFYMERGKHESNLKIGFSFSPVANEFVAEKDLNLNRVSADEDFKTAVETLANTDQFTFNNSWSATSDGTFNAPASGLASTFTHNGASSVKTTGGTTQIPDASTKFTAGDSDSFVGKFKVGRYFKLTETPDSSNKFNYDDRLTVTDMAQNDKRLTPVDAENGIYKFDTVKPAPDYEIDPVLIKATHTNTLKTRSLSIKKEISGDPDSTTTFPVQVKIKLDKTAADTDANYVAYMLPYVTSGGDSGTLDANGKVSLHQDEIITIEGIPENAAVRVSEPDALTNYYHQASCVVTDSDDTSVTNESITNGKQFTIGSKDINVVITNVSRRTVTIKKVLPDFVSDSSTGFSVHIKVSDTENGTYSDITGTFTSSIPANSGSFTDGKVAIHNGETITFAVDKNKYFTVTEENVSSPYEFDALYFTSDISTDLGNGYKCLADSDKSFEVHNKVFANYTINYTYPSRFNNLTGVKLYGDQTYTVNGKIDSKDADFSTYIDYTNSKVKEALVIANNPFESDFMYNFVWDFDNTVYNPNGAEYTANVTTTTPTTQNVHVTFEFPYDYTNATGTGWTGTSNIYSATSDNPAKTAYQSPAAISIGYQTVPYALEPYQYYDENGDLKDGYRIHCTTAPEKCGGKDFLYWSIREQSIGSDEWVEVARCYTNEYTYATFNNYHVRPIFAGDPEADTTTEEDKSEATIKFLETSRNQWNNNQKGTKSTSYAGQDMVYADFDVAYRYKGQDVDGSTDLKVGVLIENIGTIEQDYLLDHRNTTTVDGKTAYTNSLDHYKNTTYYAYDADAIKTYLRSVIKNGTAAATAQTAYQSTLGKSYTLNLKQRQPDQTLTNMNRVEYYHGSTVRSIAGNATDKVNDWTVNYANTNGVFRAYSYIVDADGNVTLSEPTYYTLYGTATLDHLTTK